MTAQSYSTIKMEKQYQNFVLFLLSWQLSWFPPMHTSLRVSLALLSINYSWWLSSSQYYELDGISASLHEVQSIHSWSSSLGNVLLYCFLSNFSLLKIVPWILNLPDSSSIRFLSFFPSWPIRSISWKFYLNIWEYFKKFTETGIRK